MLFLCISDSEMETVCNDGKVKLFLIRLQLSISMLSFRLSHSYILRQNWKGLRFKSVFFQTFFSYNLISMLLLIVYTSY